MPVTPPWARDINKTKQFQDWVNGVYPGAINTKGGVGKFGPQTTTAWNKYGGNYEKIYNNLSTDTHTLSGGIKAPSIAPEGIRRNLPGTLVGTPKVSATPNITKTVATATPASKTGMVNKLFSDGNIAAAGKFAETLAPFGSNIINAFRKPPPPKRGLNDTYTPLSKVNLDAERYAVTSGTNASNRATERNIDSNTAEAVKMFNKGQEFSKLTSINERESNANVGISNQQAVMDAQVSASNTAKENKFRDETVERGVAQQREQSANIANAGDKIVMMRNEREKGRTEVAKARVLADVYSNSGVLDRERKRLKAKGEPDPLGKNYEDILANGGEIDSTGIYTKRMMSNMHMADVTSGDAHDHFTNAWKTDAGDLARYKEKIKPTGVKVSSGLAMAGLKLPKRKVN